MRLFDSVGRSVSVEERLMDAVTAVSGSGPAYFFLMIEMLEDAASGLGLDREVASLLVRQTALGAARMVMESDRTPVELREQVSSPGGTTVAAVEVLEQGGVRDLFTRALQAAAARSRELSGD